jgi:hypothetical protein
MLVLELVPLCRADLQIARAVHVGKGPAGDRWIAQVTAMTLTGERLSGHAVGTSNADWVTVIGGIATIDVRATIQTGDGAYIYVQYRGRTDATHGVGAEPAYTTPVFETGDERYRWLNGVQAVGASQPSDLETARYEWYELRSSTAR